MARYGIERRLSDLENRGKAQRGIKVFFQSLAEGDPSVFYGAAPTGGGDMRRRPEPGEKAYSQAEIDALGAQGWQCIVVKYGEPGRNEPAPADEAGIDRPGGLIAQAAAFEGVLGEWVNLQKQQN